MHKAVVCLWRRVHAAQRRAVVSNAVDQSLTQVLYGLVAQAASRCCCARCSQGCLCVRVGVGVLRLPVFVYDAWKVGLFVVRPASLEVLCVDPYLCKCVLWVVWYVPWVGCSWAAHVVCWRVVG
jgi:hypothetical protein